jgi:hypothetical protein
MSGTWRRSAPNEPDLAIRALNCYMDAVKTMKIKPVHLLLTAAVAVVASLALGAWAPAFAQRGPDAKTPDNWAYKIENGRRVPKGQRVTNPDGSWREEIRDGGCVTRKEMSAAGEYRETRKCD